MGWDISLFRAINAWPEAQAPFWRFFSEATTRLPVKVALLLIVAGMLWKGPRSRYAILIAIVAWPIANALCDVLKYGFQTPRPFQVLPDVLLRAGRSNSFGTASAHSANMACIATIITARLGRWGWIWIVVALLTGVSRIYVGVHFPTQVLLGWTVGILVAVGILALAQRIPLFQMNVNSDNDGE